jgi:hypothetical protein
MKVMKDTSIDKEPRTVSHPPSVIVDLGQVSKRKIDKLMKAEGSLHDAVLETVEVLQSEGVVNKEAQVVIVVVEKLSDGFVFPRMRWS